MKRYRYIFILPTMLLLTSCSREDVPPSMATKPKPRNAAYPFNAVIDKPPYPYEMSAEGKREFLKKVNTLRHGQPYEAIVKLLGPPYIQQVISAKEHERPLGTRIYYYLKKLDDGVNENFDQYICLGFDNDTRLESIDNTAGLTFDNFGGVNSNTKDNAERSNRTHP